MRTNYVLIDYESVQPATLVPLVAEHFRVLVFVGANQLRVSVELAAALQRMGQRAEYVQISGSGKNALDFHIAYFVGQLAAREPDAFFHIISRDTGFDPLIQFLKSKRVLACRSADISEIPILKAARPAAERAEAVLANLQKRGLANPRTVETLMSTMHHLFQKQLSEEDLAAVLQELQRRGIVSIDGAMVSYALPPGAQVSTSIT